MKDEPKDEIRDVTLGRTGFEEGVVLPLIMGWHWATLDPSDNSRFKYMEEVAEELGTPLEGEVRSQSHRNRF